MYMTQLKKKQIKLFLDQSNDKLNVISEDDIHLSRDQKFTNIRY